jgi:hypothetical protein
MAIDNVVESVERQLEKGSIEEAQREFAVARRLYGDSVALDDLGATISAVQRARQIAEINTLIKNAKKKKRPLEDVISDLEAALSIDPQCEEAHRLLVMTRSALTRAREDDIARECESLIAAIDELIANGEPNQALEVLDTMVEDFGDFRLARVLRHTLKELL